MNDCKYGCMVLIKQILEPVSGKTNDGGGVSSKLAEDSGKEKRVSFP